MKQLLRSRTFRRPRFLGIVHKRTWPYPATDQRHVRTLHRTLAYALHYDSEAARCEALQPWLHFNNHQRAHSALEEP